MTKAQRVTLSLSVLLMLLGLYLKFQEKRAAVSADSRSSIAAVTDSSALLPNDVEKPVLPLSTDPAPRYPLALEYQRVEGEADVQFVVDTFGVAEMETFRVIHASDPQFANAVREVLPKWRFTPAESKGHKVKQYVRLPVRFQAPPGAR